MIGLSLITIGEKGSPHPVLGRVGGYEISQWYATTSAGNTARIATEGCDQARWSLDVKAQLPVPEDTKNRRITVTTRQVDQLTVEEIIDKASRGEITTDPSNLPTEYLDGLRKAEQLFFLNLGKPNLRTTISNRLDLY